MVPILLVLAAGGDVRTHVGRCQSASLTAALQRTISMSSSAWPDSRVMSTVACSRLQTQPRSHASERMSRVLQASRDPSPIVTQPAGRHSAAKLTFVYASSEVVDIGELSVAINVDLFSATVECCFEDFRSGTCSRHSRMHLRPRSSPPSRSFFAQHARILRSDLSGWHQVWSQTW
jgi:hypothetical protein